MSSITAGTSAGTALVHTADTSGSLLLKTGGAATTAVTIDASQNVSLAVPLPVASGGTGTTSATFVSLTSNVTGTLPIANGGTGLTSTPANGALDIGNGTGFTRTTLTAGTGISITNGAGSITIGSTANANSGLKTDVSKYDASIATSSSLGTAFYISLAVQLTATTEMLLIAGDASLHAVVWDNSAKTFGTPVLVRTASFANDTNIAAIGVSSTSVLVCSCVTATTALETVVLSVSGSTITVNTAVATTLAGNFAGVTVPAANNYSQRLLQMGSSYVFSYSNSTTTQPCFRAITVSGTTPTVGSELTFAAGTNAATYSQIVYSSSILVHISTTTTLLYATPISVSGTTLTVGTGTTTATTAILSVCGLLSSGRIAVAYRNTTVYGGIISITGTTASISVVNTNVDLTGGVAVQMQVFGTNAFVLNNNGSTTNYLNVLTDNAGTAVAGTRLSNPLAVSAWDIVGADSSKIFVQTLVGGSVYFLTYSISGNNPVLSAIYSSTGSTKLFTAYPMSYANVENCGVLKTSTYKHYPANTGTNVTAQSFDGTVPAINQVAVGMIYKGSINRSSLNAYSCWLVYWDSTLPTSVYFRRMEIA